jgi:hypothetical protein
MLESTRSIKPMVHPNHSVCVLHRHPIDVRATYIESERERESRLQKKGTESRTMEQAYVSQGTSIDKVCCWCGGGGQGSFWLWLVLAAAACYNDCLHTRR